MADNDDEPEQIKLMKRMVELSVERTELARERNRMAADRSRMSADRSRMSEERTKLSEDRSRMSEDRSRMSEDRSRMSADRSELSAERSYLNVERTLSVWIRTALSLMVFGIGIDRFHLMLREMPANASKPDNVSNWVGAALVAFGVAMVLVTGVRYLAYVRLYRRSHKVPYYQESYLPPLFALLTALFGIVLLVLMIAIFP
jgi:putative membrane protein